MAHFIQPITIDGTAYCCKCYGVSEALGRGTKGVKTNGSLNGEANTAVITNNCSPWKLISTEEVLYTYELWWKGGDMDDSMKYTHEGVDYYANDAMRFPLFDPSGDEDDDDAQDPWQTSGGVVGSKAFRKVGATDDPDTTYGEAWEYYDGDTLTVSLPNDGDVNAAYPLADLALQNWIGSESGNTTTNHEWKLISSVSAGEGEITFGVSCGTTVAIDLEVTSSPQNAWVLDVDIYIDGALDSTETFSYLSGILDASVSLTVTGGPCGSLVTLHAHLTSSVAASVELTAEVTSITW